MPTKLTPKESIESINKSLSILFDIQNNEELKKSFIAIEEHFNQIRNTIPKETLKVLNKKIKEANIRINPQ